MLEKKADILVELVYEGGLHDFRLVSRSSGSNGVVRSIAAVVIAAGAAGAAAVVGRTRFSRRTVCANSSGSITGRA